MKFLISTTSPSEKLDGDLYPARKRKASDGPLVNDPRTVEMRRIKEKYSLRAIDLVIELQNEGIAISQASLQSYLQGNIAGSRHKENPIDKLLLVFKKLDKRLEKIYGTFAAMSMQEIIDRWYEQLSIVSGSKVRKLSSILGLDYSTVFLWYQENRKPRSVNTLVQCQFTVDKVAAKTKKSLSTSGNKSK